MADEKEKDPTELITPLNETEREIANEMTATMMEHRKEFMARNPGADPMIGMNLTMIGRGLAYLVDVLDKTGTHPREQYLRDMLAMAQKDLEQLKNSSKIIKPTGPNNINLN